MKKAKVGGSSCPSSFRAPRYWCLCLLAPVCLSHSPVHLQVASAFPTTALYDARSQASPVDVADSGARRVSGAVEMAPGWRHHWEKQVESKAKVPQFSFQQVMVDSMQGHSGAIKAIQVFDSERLIASASRVRAYSG